MDEQKLKIQKKILISDILRKQRKTLNTENVLRFKCIFNIYDYLKPSATYSHIHNSNLVYHSAICVKFIIYYYSFLFICFCTFDFDLDSTATHN